MILRAFDMESTGLAPPSSICEIGWTDVYDVPNTDPVQWAVSQPQSFLIDPDCEIPPEVSAVHGIVRADVVGAPRLADVLPKLFEGGAHALCGHNLRFEKQWLSPQQIEDTAWIDTYAVAIRLAPQAPAHNLQTLRYWLGLAVDKQYGEPKHRAGSDSYVNAVLLTRMLGKLSIDKLIEISKEPILLPRMPFGKHVKKSFSELPIDYIDWLLSQSEMDADVLYAARHELKRRSEAHPS